ncbi:MAG: YccF domain-containing protein [Bacteroidales bacterium]
MNLAGNLIWLIFGGIFIAIEYLLAGLLLCCTIIGIPFGIQVFKLSAIAISPFGKDTVQTESSEGCLTLFMNILWIVIGDIWIALTHVFLGVILCITIIGIPFGKQHFKLAKVSLTPFGRKIIDIP